MVERVKGEVRNLRVEITWVRIADNDGQSMSICDKSSQILSSAWSVQRGESFKSLSLKIWKGKR